MDVARSRIYLKVNRALLTVGCRKNLSRQPCEMVAVLRAPGRLSWVPWFHNPEYHSAQVFPLQHVQTMAKRLMEETKAYKLIQIWRGKPPANIKGLEIILVLFSYLVADFPEIAEIDLNPLAISAGKPCALDARIILDKDYSESAYPYPHLVITPYPTRLIIPWH